MGILWAHLGAIVCIGLKSELCLSVNHHHVVDSALWLHGMTFLWAELACV